MSTSFFFLIKYQRIFNYVDIDSYLEYQRVCSGLAVIQSLTATAASLETDFWLVFISPVFRNLQLGMRR